LSGSITVQVGSGTAQTITVGSTSNTLQSLVTAINAAGAGVKATLVTDTTGTRLNLVSSTSGAAGQLTIGGSLTDATTGKAISFQAGQTGADASLSVDGIALTSASNTVTTAVPGVTMQLLAASTSPVQVEITNDTASVSTAFSTMVNAYNAVIKDVAGQEKNNASGQAQPLFGNPTLAMIQSQLSSVLFAGGASGSISNLSQLGISTNSDGTLALDTGTLTNALNANPTAVQGYFQNTSSFGSTLASVLNNLGTQAPSGAVYLAQQQNSKQEAALNADITQENALLATQKTQLTTELNQANQILQSIPSQLNQVNEIYSAITGYNQNRIG
ncbi:MAG: flagellar filament capping protein FliD, partial [Acidobacteriota bacterium]|nr:flagellar filament capping protein FliD [Acidobacteriota bacterium]